MRQTRERVVVGVDGSECAQAALRWAERYATAFDASVVLTIGWHWPISYGAPVGYGGFDPEADARHIVDTAAKSLDLPAERIECAVVEGMAGDVLVDASKGAALLVVGTRGHGAITSSILGSTSNHCAHHAHCPIVIVR